MMTRDELRVEALRQAVEMAKRLSTTEAQPVVEYAEAFYAFLVLDQQAKHEATLEAQAVKVRWDRPTVLAF